MTQDETNRILSTILEAYPSFGKDRDPAFTSRLWHTLFEFTPYREVEKALMQFISTDTRGFPPPPGALREIILERMKEAELSETEAWNLVRKAIGRSMYYSGEEFGKLPPALQRIIGSPDNLHSWAALDERAVESSLMPWFLRAYAGRMEKERRAKLLPPSGGYMLPER